MNHFNLRLQLEIREEENTPIIEWLYTTDAVRIITGGINN